MSDEQVFASFVKDLRWTLRRMYDPREFRRSPLLRVFSVLPLTETSALRQILLAAIEALKPQVQPPHQERAWRTYRVLYSRYVEQFTSLEVAESLGISQRQMERDETAAADALAEYLWTHYDLAHAYAQQLPAATEADEEQRGDLGPSREQEMQWLQKSLISEASDVAEVVSSVLKTLAPLLQATQTTLECPLPEHLPRVSVSSAGLRQALLSVLTVAVHTVSGSSVRVHVQAEQERVRIDVYPLALATDVGSPVHNWAERLDIARQLLDLSAGSLDVIPHADQSGLSTVRLTLPCADEAVVLVVDDNADALQLFQRYVAGTRYAFAGCAVPEGVVPLATRLKPAVIVLDVMLPGIDGWELLQQLRENPVTSATPIIVCSILAEESLAMAMGAAQFIRKPVNRQEFVAALDRLAAAVGPESSE
jgi:CheY-like chemotaxis protein